MKIATLCYVKDTDNRTTLMIHRNKKENDYHKGKWNGLGGKLEPGENPEECAIREVREESGLEIKNLKLCGFIYFPLFDQVEDWHVFIFTADKSGGELIDSPEGQLEWIPDDQLTSLILWEGDKIFLEWIREGKSFCAVFKYINKQYVSHDVVFIKSL
jgi:8-oxo-dGTP diphosphatase